jgi:hypothetical protein
MQRMRANIDRWTFPAFLIVLAGLAPALRADLIRPHGYRAYPSIAGDMIGEQTYSYDPHTRTGVFRVSNAPHVIALGPGGRRMFDVMPDVGGTLEETLELTLDHDGRLVDQPDNAFELRGSVTIDGKVYEGVLLSGRPTAFGAETKARGAESRDPNGVFDLSLEVTGGALAGAFGPRAYFRITPQGSSTFQGDFTADFSGGRPLTSLRAARAEAAPVTVPEPSLVLFVAVCGGCLAMRASRRRKARRRQAFAASLSRPGTSPTASRAPRSRSAGRAPA